tara:strand:- start:3705 stop:5963 length:2259 start_codon:yes stop_codon:yes gene_type:complete
MINMRNFKILFFAFLITFTCLITKSFSEVVTKVEVKGNKRISAETILIFGDINIGENYESMQINSLIKKLYDTNYFSDISVELKDGKMTILVSENPIINEVVFNGEKASKYKEALIDFLTLRENTSFLNAYVKSDINKVKEFYRQLGFYFIEIDLDIEQLENNKVNLIYTLEKGDKAKISKIYFLGDKKIRDKRLRDIITSQEGAFWKFLSKNVYLNKGRIDLDKRLLKNYYKNKGYYEVDISSSNVEYSEGEGFVLTYTINAGKRYTFNKFSLDIAKELDQNAFASLEKEFNKVVGDYYSQRKLTKILEKIDELSQQKELQFINHGITETLNDTNGIDVLVHIYEGEKFTIERVNIVGNNVTNDSVIRGELIVDEGDPYSALLVTKSVNRLKARNIFGQVDSKIIEGSSPNLKILEISITERATGEISAGAGVGTDGTSVMASVTENNWLGRGIQLEAAANISEEKVSGNFFVRNPNYKFTNNSVFAGMEISASDLIETSGYETTKTGFQLGTEFEQYENVYLSPSLNLSLEDIEVQSSASNEIKKMDGTFTNLDFAYGITVDKRNQRFQPTSGHKTKFLQSLPIIQESSALLNGLESSAYHAFSEDLIGSIKFFARSIHAVDNEDVRLTSRLFLPPKRIRGFQTRKIGPKDGDDYIGGNYATALGFEAQLPNLLPEETRTDISIFMDNANLWHVDYSSDIDDTNKIRSSVGVSANVWTAVGPLSFTIAQDLTKHSNDATETFNFRLGTSF